MNVLHPGSSNTDWSVIARLAESDEQRAAEALEQVVRRFWPAIFAYIRKSGRNPHKAADLTQGFICDVVLGRRLIHQADPERGRLRTLVITALKNYLISTHRHSTAKKRSPQSGSEVALGESERTEADTRGLTPESAFAQQWSATLVRRVLDLTRRRCVADELETHWKIFEGRVIRPMLLGETPLEYEHLAEQHELKDSSQAANMLVTVKRRFAAAMREEVGRTVSTPEQVDDEIQLLLADLEGNS